MKDIGPPHNSLSPKGIPGFMDGYLSEALIILGFTFAATNINQYLYGIDNHAIIIPFIKQYLNPDLYPNDYLVEQRLYFYTFFWNALAWLIHTFSIKMTVLFFIIHFLFMYVTFLAVYRLASLLFRNTDVALLSLFFLLFSKNILGGDSTIYRFLDAAMVARPILIFSFYHFLKERYLNSYLLLGVAFLIHPLSAVYVIAILGILSLLNMRRIGPKKFSIFASVLFLLMSPSLIWKIIYSPASLNLFSADPNWIELLRLRSSHHLFPFSWSGGLILPTILFLFAFWISWKHRPGNRHHSVIVFSSVIILVLWTIGTVFSELLPVSIVLQLQLFRSSYFLYIFAVLYVANYVYRQLGTDTSITARVMAVILTAGLLYQARVWLIALGGFFFFALGRRIYKFFHKQDLSPKQFKFSLTFLALLLGTSAFFMRGGISIENAQDPDWLAVQDWAKQHGALEDLFIVPPLLKTEGFRVESERTIYGDWKDGTQMFFNPAFGYEWFERMKRLEYEPPDEPEFGADDIDARLKKGYNGLTELDFIDIAQRMAEDFRRVFVVHFRENPYLEFPILYQNDGFVVYEILSEEHGN